jgi:hypothetical protein
MNVRNIGVKMKFGLYCLSSLMAEFWKRDEDISGPITWIIL